MVDFNFVCRTCKTIEYLGSGCASTWMTNNKTVAEFDADTVTGHVRSLAKNQALRRCLLYHAGHDHGCHSMDYCSIRKSDGALILDTPWATDADEPLIADYAQYRESIAPEVTK